MKNQTDMSLLTVGDLLQLARGLKELGVTRGSYCDFSFEFAPGDQSVAEAPTKFLTPEEYEEAARKVRKQIAEEAFEAS